jgi:flagellum-specific peptidoglycan hydrolase FlgJ
MTSQFPADVIAAAQAAHRLYFPKGPYVSVSLAQWAVESAYGHDEPPGSDNPFGIKAVAGQPYVISMTREVVNGLSEHIPQHFAKYASLTDAFDAHARLLATSPIYAEAQRATNPESYVRAMAKHYATAPNYADVLLAVMKSQDLYRFDEQPAPAVGSA